jgi:hypothetical protein
MSKIFLRHTLIKKISLTLFLTSLSLYIFTIWKCITYNRFYRDGIYFDKILSGQLSTKIYDKRDDFNFKIINFPNICSNIPASPAYGVYISQLIRYSREPFEKPSWSWSHGSWIYNYMCNQFLSPLKLWIRIRNQITYIILHLLPRTLNCINIYIYERITMSDH